MILKINYPSRQEPEEEKNLGPLPKAIGAYYQEPLSYGEEFSRGVARGVDQLQALGYGAVGLAGDLVGSDGVRDFGLRGYERNMEEAAENMGTVAGFTDIEDADDFVRWSIGTLAEFSPQLLLSIGTGGVGAQIGRRAVSGAVKEFVERKAAEKVAGGMAADLAKKAAQLEAAQQITSRAMKTGIGAAGAATGVGQMTGSIYGDTQDAGLAIKYGVPAGLIEGVYDRVIGGKLVDIGFGQQGKRGLVKGALGTGALGAVIEGPGEELPQTYLEQMAKAEADPNYDINSPEAVKQRIDATAAGALAGGAVAGTTGTLSELAPLTQRALRDRELPTLGRTMLGEKESEPQTNTPGVEFLDTESTPIVDDRIGSMQARRFRLSGDDKVYWSVNNPSEAIKPFLFDLKPYTGLDEWMILDNTVGIAMQQIAANGGRKEGAPGTQKWDTVSKFTAFQGVTDPLSKTERRISAMTEDPNADVIKDLNIGKFDPRFDPTTEPRPLADAAADKDEFVLDGVRGYLAKDETGKTVFKSSEDGQEVVLPKNVEDAVQDDSVDANQITSLLDEETAARFQYSPKPVSIKGTQRIQKAIDAVSTFEGATDEAQKLASLQSLSAADLAAAKDQIARGELAAEQAPDGSAKTRELNFYAKLKNSLSSFEQAKADAVNAGTISAEKTKTPEGSADTETDPSLQLTEAETEFIKWNQEKGMFELRQGVVNRFANEQQKADAQKLVDQKNSEVRKSFWEPTRFPGLEQVKQQIEQGTRLAADLAALEQLEKEPLGSSTSATFSAKNYFGTELPNQSKKLTAAKEFEQSEKEVAQAAAEVERAKEAFAEKKTKQTQKNLDGAEEKLKAATEKFNSARTVFAQAIGGDFLSFEERYFKPKEGRPAFSTSLEVEQLTAKANFAAKLRKNISENADDPLVKLLIGRSSSINKRLEESENIFRAAANEIQNKPVRADGQESTNARELLPEAEKSLSEVQAALPDAEVVAETSRQQIVDSQDSLELEKARIKRRMREVGGPLVRVVYNDPQSGRKLYGALVADEQGKAQDQEGNFRFRPYGSTFVGDADLRLSREAVAANIEMDALGSMEENLKSYIGDRADTRNTSLLDNMLIAGRLLQQERRVEAEKQEEIVLNRSEEQVKEEVGSYAPGEKISFVLPGVAQDLTSQDFIAPDGTRYRPLNVGEFRGKVATNAPTVPTGTKDDIELNALRGLKDKNGFRQQVARELAVSEQELEKLEADTASGIPLDQLLDREIKRRITNVERPIYDQGFNAGSSGKRALPPNQRSGVWMLGYEAGRNQLEKNTSWLEKDTQRLEKKIDDARNDGVLFDRFFVKIGNPNDKPEKAGRNRRMPKQIGVMDQLVKGSEIGAYSEGRSGEIISKSNWRHVSRLPKKESYFTIQEKDDPQPFINQFQSIGSGRVGSSRRIMTGQGNIQVLVQDAELTEEEQIITAVLQQTGIKTAPRNEIYSRLAELGFKVAPPDKPAIFDLGTSKLVEQESFSFVDDIYGIKVPVAVGLFSNKQNPDAFFAKTHVQLDGAFAPLDKAFKAAQRYERAKVSKGRTAAAGLKDAAIDKFKAEQDLRRAVLAAMDKGYDVRVRTAETTAEGKKSIGAEFEEYLADLGIGVSPDRGHFIVTKVSYNPNPQGSVENYSAPSDKAAEVFQRSVRKPGQDQQEAAQTLKAVAIQKGRAASINTQFGLGVAERILTNWTAKNLEIQQRRKELSRAQAGRGKGAAARAVAQTRGFNAFGERLYGILFDKARRHIENAPTDDETKTLWLDEVKAAIGKQTRAAQRSMLTDSLREKLQTRLNKLEARWDQVKPEKGFTKSRKAESWGQSTPDPTQTQASYRRSLQIWQDEKDEALATEEIDYLRETLPRLKAPRAGVIEARAYDSALKAVKAEMIAREMQRPVKPSREQVETALAQDEKIQSLRQKLNSPGISKQKANNLRRQLDVRSREVISDLESKSTTPRKQAEIAVERLLNETEMPIEFRNRVKESTSYKDLFDYLGLVKLQGENQWGFDKSGSRPYRIAENMSPEVLYRTLEFAQDQLFRFTPEQEKIAAALEAAFEGRLEEVQSQYGEKTIELLKKYQKAGTDRAKVKKFRRGRKDEEEVVLGTGTADTLSEETLTALEAENFARLVEFGMDQLTPGQQREVEEILEQYGPQEAQEARLRFIQENKQNFKDEDQFYTEAELSKMEEDAEKAVQSATSTASRMPNIAASELLSALIADSNARVAAEKKKSKDAAERLSKLSEADKAVLSGYAKALEAVYATNLFGRRQGRKVPPGLVWQAGSRASRTVKALREQNESLDVPAADKREIDPTWGGSRIEASEAVDDLVYDALLRWLKTESGRQGRPGQEAAAGVLIPEDLRKKADEAFNNIKQLVNITPEEQAQIDSLWDKNFTKDSQALENKLLDEKAEKFRDLMLFMGARTGGTTAQRRRGRELMRQVLPSFEGGNLKTELPEGTKPAPTDVTPYALDLMQRKGVVPPEPSQYALDLMRRKGIASAAVPKQPNAAESIKSATPQPGNIPVDAAQSKAARAKFVQSYGMLSDAEMLKLTDEEIDRAYAAASSRASAEGAAMAIDSVIQATPSMDTLLSMSEEDLISGYIREEKAAQQEGGRVNPVELALTGKSGQGAAAERQLNLSTLLKARAFGNYETFLRHVANDTNIPRAQRLIAKQYLDAQKSGFKWRDVAMQIASFATANDRKAPWAGLVGMSADSKGGMAVYINTDAYHDGGPIQTMLHEADHILSYANVYAEQFGIKLNETQKNARESLRQKWNEALLKAGEKLIADGVIDGKQVQSMSAEQKRDFFSAEIQKLVNSDGKYRAYNGVSNLAEFVTEAKVSNEFRSLLADLGFNKPVQGEQKFNIRRLGKWLTDLFTSVAELVTGRRIDPSSELAKIYADSWELSGDRNFAVQPTQLAKSLGIDSANLGETNSAVPTTGNPEGVILKSGNKNYQLDLVEENGKYFVRSQWGSEGRKMQSRQTPLATYKQAKTYFDKKLAEKTDKGYARVNQPPPDNTGGSTTPTTPTPPQSPSDGRPWLSDEDYRRERAVNFLRRKYQGSWDYLSSQEKEQEIRDYTRRDSNRGYYQRADYPAMSPAASPDRGLVARFSESVKKIASRVDNALAKLEVPDLKDPNSAEESASSFSSRTLVEVAKELDRVTQEANLALREVRRLNSVWHLFSFEDRRKAEERHTELGRKRDELRSKYADLVTGEFEKSAFQMDLEVRQAAEEMVQKFENTLGLLALLDEATEIINRSDEFTPPMSPATSPDRGLVSRLVSGGAKEVITSSGDRVRFSGWFESEKGAPQEVSEFYTQSVNFRKTAERKIESLATILSKRLKGAQDIPLETVQTALGSIENPLTPEQANEIRELEKDGMQREADELRDEYRALNRDNFRRRQEEAMNQLPDNIAEIVGEMRGHIDTLGQQIKGSEGIENGIAVTIDANKGVYLNRSYLVFQDEATAENHRKAVRNNPRLMADASDFVRRRLLDEKADAAVRRAFREGAVISKEDARARQTVSDDEVARGIERLLNVNEQGFGRIIMAGRIPGQKTGETLRIFDQRGNIDAVVQKLWGVIDDPVTNYVNTALKMSAFVANDQFLTKLRDAGLDNGLLYDPLNPESFSEEDRALYDEALEAARDENPNLLDESRFNKQKLRTALAKQNPVLLSVFEQAERNVPQGYVKLSGENNKSLAPVSGMYAQEDLAKWMFEKYPPGGSQAQEAWLRGFTLLTMIPMAMKTVGSVAGQARNFLSGFLSLVATGNLRVTDTEWRTDFIEGLKITFGDAWGKLDNAANRKELLAKIEEVGNLGVLNQSVGSNLINDTLQLRRAALIADPDEREKSMLQILGQRGMKVWGKTRDLFIDSYGASDDFFKFVIYTSELGKYRRAMPNMSEQQLKEKAAKIARDIHWTYSDTYAFTKGLKRQPFIAPFISFTSEVIRTSVNLVKLAGAEMREGRETGNEELYRIGRNRALGIVTAALGPSIAAFGVAAAAGISGDDEEDLRRFLPDWQKNNQLLIFNKSNGKMDFIDISFTDPYSYLKTPIVAGLSALFSQDEATAGERMKDMVVSALGEVFAPWAGEQLFAGAIMDIARNKDASGREIVNWQDDGATIARGIVGHIGSMFTPGTWDSIERVLSAAKGEISDTGRSYDFGNELMGFIGTRTREMDARQALGFKATQFMRDYRDASSIFTGELLTRGTRAPGDIAEAYRRANDSTRSLVRGFGDIVRAAERLGIPKGELRSILKGANISDDMIKAIATGKFKYEPSKQAITRAIEAGNTARVREAQAAMR